MLALIAVITWQRAEISDLETELTTYKLSNESLQKQAKTHLKFIEGASADLQACLDSKNTLVKRLEGVNALMRKAKPVTIDKNKVVDNETLRKIIDSLNRPLPDGNNIAPHGLRQN